MSYSQKQGPGGNGGGGTSNNQASQHSQPTLAGIQQQMQNLVHGQSTLPQSSQAGLNAFLTQQHFEMLKQQQQQLLLSNPQLQQRFQQQMQQSKDRGEPLALTRTPAAAELLNKTYQQHHQQQSNGNNGPGSTLSPFQQQQMQAANLMQQIYAYQLQQLPQQQQQQQQHHQQSQQSHHQQQSVHQHQQKSHTQPSLPTTGGLQSNKQQHNPQIQQSQYAQKYIPSTAHSKSTPSNVGVSTTPATLSNQLKPPNLPPSTQITPIPSPKLSTSNNNLQNKSSSSTSVKQVPPSISLLPAKQSPASLSSAPIAAHLHHHQNKSPLSIPSQYSNPVSKTPLVSAIPSPFPSHYQKMSNQSQIHQQQQQGTVIQDQEHKQQSSAVSLTKQQAPQSSAVTISSCSTTKATTISHTPPKPASLPPLISVPLKEPEDSTRVPSSTAAIAALPPPPPTIALSAEPLPLAEAKPMLTPATTAVVKPTDTSGIHFESHLVADESNSSNNVEPKSVDEEKSEVSTGVHFEALSDTTKKLSQEGASEKLAMQASHSLTTKPYEKNLKDTNIDKYDKHCLGVATDSDSGPTVNIINKTPEQKSNLIINDENVVNEKPSVEKDIGLVDNTSPSLEPQTTNIIKPDKQEDETKLRISKNDDNIHNTENIKSEKEVEKFEEKSHEQISLQKVEKDQHIEKIDSLRKDEIPEKSEHKNADKNISKEKTLLKLSHSEKPIIKLKTQRLSKAAAAAAISADASGESSDKTKDLLVVSKVKGDEIKIVKNEKTDLKRVQSKSKLAQALEVSPVVVTPNDRKSKRHRLKTILYQSPLPELAFITKLSASEASNSPKPMSVEDKLIVFYKHEYMAVRNAEGGFFLCQTLQNVYRSSPRISIRWLSEDKKDNTVFIPDFYDHTDIECVLTTVDLKKLEKGQLRLPKAEKSRIENILKKAIDVEKGILPRPDVTEENPDGLDISLYKDESQIEKKFATSSGGKISNLFRTSGSKRNRSKTKSPAKKKQFTIVAKKRKNVNEIRSSISAEEDDESEIDTDKEYKPSRKKSILSNTVQSTKPQRAQRSPLAKARAASPITPTSSRSNKSVLQKNETPASTSSVSSRNDRAAKRRALENTIKISEVPVKKQTSTIYLKTFKGTDKSSNNATTTEERDNIEAPKNLNKTVTHGTSIKKNRSSAIIIPATSGPSDTRPSRSRK